MEWINKPKKGIKPMDNCTFYLCFTRENPCGDKNPCGYKICATKYCVIDI